MIDCGIRLGNEHDFALRKPEQRRLKQIRTQKQCLTVTNPMIHQFSVNITLCWYFTQAMRLTKCNLIRLFMDKKIQLYVKPFKSMSALYILYNGCVYQDVILAREDTKTDKNNSTAQVSSLIKGFITPPTFKNTLTLSEGDVLASVHEIYHHSHCRNVLWKILNFHAAFITGGAYI